MGIKAGDKVRVLTDTMMFFQLAHWEQLALQPACNPYLPSYLKPYVAFTFSLAVLLSSAAWRCQCSFAPGSAP